MSDDAFDLATAFSNVPVDEDTLKQDEKMKRRAEKRAQGDREEKRRIVREKRQLKKDAREKNKKRKRGEIVSSDEEEDGEENAEEQQKDSKKQKSSSKKKEKPVEFGVWVGNLAFKTTREQITKFFSDCGTVTRLKCPSGNGKNSNNKGFAYVMFATKEEADKAVEKSEQKIDGRALLIKASDNFERKDGLTVKEVKKQKNPPCATLFIGNLPFDATKEKLKEAFAECGDIMNVRLGTFEDSGKCKGFGYVDFETVEDATAAIRATNKHMMDGRKMRVEFGSEDAYRRGRPWLQREDARAAAKKAGAPSNDTQQQDEQSQREQYNNEESYEKPAREYRREKREKREMREKKPSSSSDKRVAPGLALSQAQRQKPTVQAFKGTKITFD
ncbi:hypothetical protein BDA99DRAFT_15050 [Phascolomyces articulosus]|uniref:RRM domain-containing protein n=1 Tax=Phascolomyces articulosus TaxID=60185 RepID=A0AAD5KCG1_9FUNG|nr:hypothetical protein BDA99DRAFT_15050 [Phascolomyces articulosus]